MRSSRRHFTNGCQGVGTHNNFQGVTVCNSHPVFRNDGDGIFVHAVSGSEIFQQHQYTTIILEMKDRHGRVNHPATKEWLQLFVFLLCLFFLSMGYFYAIKTLSTSSELEARDNGLESIGFPDNVDSRAIDQSDV